MKDNNVVAFYCNNCHETVLNCEHNFEQLHEKGLCAECLKKQNKPTVSKTESVDNYLCKWQKLKEWLEEMIKEYEPTYDEWMALNYDFYNKTNKQSVYKNILDKMQELESEDE